jgi:Holliday junction resolvasome RuvABC endonuclease subunit
MDTIGPMLVSLDLSGKTGWTSGYVHQRPLFGTEIFKAPPTDVGTFMQVFNRWLLAIIKQTNPEIVIFESPILPRQARLTTLRRLYGMAALVQLHCAEQQIRCEEAQPSTIKQFWTGDGWAKKPAMIEMAMARGYRVTDDNQADALALRFYMIHQLYPEAARKMRFDLGPLGAVAINR